MFIEFENILNARELGGIRLENGSCVKPGLLLRTASLAKASDNDLDRLSRQYKIKHIFDFRDPTEVERNPDREVNGAQNHSIPALKKLPGNNRINFSDIKPEQALELFENMYRDMALDDVTAAAYKEFFHIILSSEGGAVLWHCTQGKDRTGIAGILFLTALGCDEKTAINEYYLSNIPMNQHFQQDYVNAGCEPAKLEFMRMMLFVMPECLNKYLLTIKMNYGGLEGYLRRRLGLADSDFAALRKFYTE